MNKIRWGIAGPGCIAHKFAQAIKNVEEAELVAVASRSIKRAEEFAEEYGAEYAFASYEEMAASPLVDAVYVSTAHPFHKPCAEIFLNAKKHVLCEKPLCVNANQAKALAECANKNGVFLMEAMWTRFLPAIKETIKIISEGKIGKPLGMDASFCYTMEYDDDPKVFENKLAGGALLDVGPYPLHLAALVFGTDTEEIKAFSNVENGVDLHTQMLIKYKTGAIAALSSAVKLKKPETAYIYGKQGSVFIPDFYQAQRLVLSCSEGEKEIKLPYDGNGFEDEIREACRCIKEGKTESDTLPLSESIKILEQMDSIRKQTGICYPLEGENF